MMAYAIDFYATLVYVMHTCKYPEVLQYYDISFYVGLGGFDLFNPI